MASKTKTNFRWVICAMLFVATAVNYLDILTGKFCP